MLFFPPLLWPKARVDRQHLPLPVPAGPLALYPITHSSLTAAGGSCLNLRALSLFNADPQIRTALPSPPLSLPLLH